MVGCQDIMNEISGRSGRRESAQVNSPTDGKGLMRSSKSFHGRSTSKYHLKEELSSKINILDTSTYM